MSITDLANRLQLPAALVKDFLDMFQQSRLVLPLADEERFVLGRAAERDQHQRDIGLRQNCRRSY